MPLYGKKYFACLKSSNKEKIQIQINKTIAIPNVVYTNGEINQTLRKIGWKINYFCVKAHTEACKIYFYLLFLVVFDDSIVFIFSLCCKASASFFSHFSIVFDVKDFNSFSKAFICLCSYTTNWIVYYGRKIRRQIIIGLKT